MFPVLRPKSGLAVFYTAPSSCFLFQGYEKLQSFTGGISTQTAERNQQARSPKHKAPYTPCIIQGMATVKPWLL